ncbi:MAG: DUF4403 family protein, partial [Saprospiraceae bacterium]|nr:DUF4403 family protein [Saprospiraceae bacterium]
TGCITDTKLYKILWLVVIFMICVPFSCSKKIAPPLKDAQQMMNLKRIPISTVNFNISISDYELNRVVNELVNTTIGEGLVLEDGYKCKARLASQMQVQAVDNTIHLVLPIDLEIQPRSQISQVKAMGQLELQLVNKLDIFNNQILSKTDLIDYRWLKKPILKVYGLPIPIEPIANQIVKRYKSELCAKLDLTLVKNLDLNKIKKSVQQFFTTPFYSTEDNIIHVYSSPVELALGPASYRNNEISLPVLIYLENVISESKPEELYNDLTFSMRPYVEESSLFYLQSRIPVNYLEILTKEAVENQEFGSGMARIKITSLNLSGQEDKVSVGFNSTGAFNGRFLMTFIPEFNQESKLIELKELKLKVENGKSINKAIFSLVRGIAEGKIKKTLEEQLNTMIKDYKESIQTLLDDKELVHGLNMNGELEDFNIRNFYFMDNRMYFNLESKLKLKLKVNYVDPMKILRK